MFLVCVHISSELLFMQDFMFFFVCTYIIRITRSTELFKNYFSIVRLFFSTIIYLFYIASPTKVCRSHLQDVSQLPLSKSCSPMKIDIFLIITLESRNIYSELCKFFFFIYTLKKYHIQLWINSTNLVETYICHQKHILFTPYYTFAAYLCFIVLLKLTDHLSLSCLFLSSNGLTSIFIYLLKFYSAAIIIII